jgi:hypothetical protein
LGAVEVTNLFTLPLKDKAGREVYEARRKALEAHNRGLGAALKDRKLEENEYARAAQIVTKALSLEHQKLEQEGLSIYYMIGDLQDEWFEKAKYLIRKSSGDPYSICTEGKPPRPASKNPGNYTKEKFVASFVKAYGKELGEGAPKIAGDKWNEWRHDLQKRYQRTYIIVIRAGGPNRVYLRRASQTSNYRGHSSIAGEGGPVLFAGDITFTGDGLLQAWTNTSGHYRVGGDLSEGAAREHIKKQTRFAKNTDDGDPLLPMDKFFYRVFEG